MLEGDKDIFEALKQRQIKYGVARELNKITDEKYRRMYLQSAIDCDPPHRVVAKWVADWRMNAQPAPAVAPAVAPANGEPAVVPYVDPGFTLALIVRDELRRYQEAHGAPPKLLLMVNHGLVALSSHQRRSNESQS